MISKTEEDRLEQLKENLGLLRDEIASLHRQMLEEIIDATRMTLQRRIDRRVREAKELENQIAELEARRNYGWENNLFKIDFDKADDALRPAIKHLKKPGRAALLLLRESRDMMGEYCVERLFREWLRQVHSQIVDIRIDLDDVTLETIINELAKRAGLDINILNQSDATQKSLLKLCQSVESGLLFITLQFSSDLKYSPDLLRTVRDQLLNGALEIIQDSRESHGATHVVIMLIAENDLNPAAIEDDLFCPADDFDCLNILQIPTEFWDVDVIESWLTGHSGLKLTSGKRREIATTVVDNCRGCPPRRMDTELRKLLKQMTEVQSSINDQEHEA